MQIARRQFLKLAAGSGIVATAAPLLDLPLMRTTAAGAAERKRYLTGPGLPPDTRWHVNGTDLGIPYVIEDGSIGYVFGDTFSSAMPGAGWRSPVILRSSSHPGNAGGIVFESAAGISGNGTAPQVISYNHNATNNGYFEVTLIPNDAVYFPETGRHVMSYMSINNWTATSNWGWQTNYCGLAYSDDGGNTFVRAPGAVWINDGGNQNPYQMCTMQRMGDHVYVFSVRAGRQNGPMMLRRVHWQDILDPASYEGWGWNGSNWDWGRPPTAILSGRFGEPSVRRLADGTWAMSYLEMGSLQIKSRHAVAPDAVWSAEKTQVTFQQEANLYGGFIHPWSLNCADGLHMIVSQWTSSNYRSSHYVGTL